MGLNQYRNTHFQILNQAKIAFKAQVMEAVEHWYNVISDKQDDGLSPPLHFVYTIYPGSNRKFDLGNVLPIVGKFTEDALIEMGIITDDCYKVISKIDYRFGSVDKENQRVELDIYPII